MPFTKVGKDEYTSPSGRHWSGAQVRLYYATNGFGKGTDEPKKKDSDYAKKAKWLHKGK